MREHSVTIILLVLQLRIIALKTIRTFWEIPEYKDSERPLRSWYGTVKKADWSRPVEIKDQYANASILSGNRVVFNIAGNKYRLIVRFNYAFRIGYIRFIGTHEQYDRIDAETI